jgi:hypothetical protein
MRLIFVNEIGTDYKGQKQYEFIFSDESTEIDMDELFDVPASSTSSSKSPNIEYIDQVGLLKDTDIVFELIQNSDYFGVIDAVDGIIAIAWEKSNFDLEEDRLFFRFGETYENVSKKLKERGISLEKKELNFKQS